MRAAIVILLLTGTVHARYPVFHEPVLSYPRLPWTITADEAVVALTAMHASPRLGELHAYQAGGGADHTSEPSLDFVPRARWLGHATFDPAHRLVSVAVTVAELSPGAQRDELAALVTRFGTPTSTTKDTSRWDFGKQSVVAMTVGHRFTIVHHLDR